MDNNPLFVWSDLASRVFSPYDLGPYLTNPLKAILDECIGFERLATSPIHLYVTATNVRTGKPRVFTTAEVTPDALLASGCLPQVFPAIEIGGEAYWDGGYSANPALRPLILECEAGDTILVQINPIDRPGIPMSARDILDRMNEIAFNATLLKELRILGLLRRAEVMGDEAAARWGRMRLHRISSDVLLELGHSSKLNAEWAFLAWLRDQGRTAAATFLDTDRDALGHHSTLDVSAILDD